MIVSSLTRSPGWVFLGLATAILAASWGIASSSAVLASPRVLGAAIALDVGLMIPTAYWILVVRRRLARARTMISIMALCILATSAIVPTSQTGVFAWVRHYIAPAEIGLLLYIVCKVRAVLGSHDASHADDPVAAAFAALQDALGNAFVARLIASEFAVLYYAAASWGLRPQVPEGAAAFASAKSATVLAVLIPIIAVETAAMHMLISHWSVMAAWILAALNLYAMLWVLGDYRAMVLRPSYVTHDEIVIRVGLRCMLRAQRAAIDRAQQATWRDEGRCLPMHLNMAAPESPNVLLFFREPIRAQRFFGIQTTVRSVGLRAQDANGMLNALNG